VRRVNSCPVRRAKLGPSLTSLTKISDANPWQKEYNWGTAELVTWTSMDGVPLQGILYKPENFDPSRKYPLIAYLYEDLSDNLHSYVPPNARNVINRRTTSRTGTSSSSPTFTTRSGTRGRAR